MTGLPRRSGVKGVFILLHTACLEKLIGRSLTTEDFRCFAADIRKSETQLAPNHVGIEDGRGWYFVTPPQDGFVRTPELHCSHGVMPATAPRKKP